MCLRFQKLAHESPRRWRASLRGEKVEDGATALCVASRRCCRKAAVPCQATAVPSGSVVRDRTQPAAWTSVSPGSGVAAARGRTSVTIFADLPSRGCLRLGDFQAPGIRTWGMESGPPGSQGRHRCPVLEQLGECSAVPVSLCEPGHAAQEPAQTAPGFIRLFPEGACLYREWGPVRLVLNPGCHVLRY